MLDAAAVQPLTYLQLVYASIIGVTIYGETLSLNTIIGLVIVVASGIFTIWREYWSWRQQRGCKKRPCNFSELYKSISIYATYAVSSLIWETRHAQSQHYYPQGRANPAGLFGKVRYS